MKYKTRLKKAYWQGVTDVICCIGVSMIFAIMFVYGI